MHRLTGFDPVKVRENEGMEFDASSDGPRRPSDNEQIEARAARPACPVCGGPLIDIRAKLQCSRCHTICETCCEGGPG